MNQSVLVVDDNAINRLNLRLLLKRSYEVLEAADLEAADRMLAGHRVDLMVLDLALPPEPDNPQIGMGYLARLHEESPETPVVVVTGHNEQALQQQAQQLGAIGFFTKPFDPDEVQESIAAALEKRWNELRAAEMQRVLEHHVGFELLGKSAAMQKLRQMIAQMAPTPSPVLIVGETGSGKELVARQIHQQSPRRDHPFIAINCAAMEAEHLEPELFGHEMGAYPGAANRQLGWFERANGGTLFLDGVGGLPLSVQGKLLRVLENGQFTRLGGDAPIQSNVRLICSSRRPLEGLVEQGLFRDDLFYRIHVLEIRTVPLRENREDILPLAHHLLQRKALLCNRRIDGFSEQARQQMLLYPWPGNVRELENVLERAVVLAASNLIDSLPLQTEQAAPTPVAKRERFELADYMRQLPREGVDADALLAEFEELMLRTALERNLNIKARAGRWLGFGDRAKDKMRYLCDKYGLGTGDDH